MSSAKVKRIVQKNKVAIINSKCFKDESDKHLEGKSLFPIDQFQKEQDEEARGHFIYIPHILSSMFFSY